MNKYLHTVACVGFLFTLNYDARNHELKKKQLFSYADHCFNAILTMSDFCTYRCKSKIVSEQYDGGHVDTVFGSFHIFFNLTLIYLHL